MLIESGADSLAGDLLLAAHVAAGVVALLAGLGAVLTRKGSSRHNRFGKTYVATMAFVVVTAVPLAAWIANWFLLAVAVFSGYLVFGGYRAVQRRRAGLTGPTRRDDVGHGTMLVAGVGMIVAGGWQTVTGSAGLAPVLIVFGAIGGALSVRSLRSLRAGGTGPGTWIGRHVTFMGGAYIATVTAAITVNLPGLPPLVRWLGPTAVGVPLIVYGTRRYEAKFAPRSQSAD